MRSRRSPPVDPEVLARVTALLDAGGWTPPAGGDPQSSLPADGPSSLPADRPSSLPADGPSSLPADGPSSLPADLSSADGLAPWPLAGPAWQETAERRPGGEGAGRPDTGSSGELDRSALDRWRTGRLDPGRRGVAALALVAVLAAALAAVVVLRSRPQEVAVPATVLPGTPVPGSTVGGPAGADAPLPSGRPVAAGSSAPEVVVAVGGKVRRPGLVRLPAGSRVDDAVQAAGGALRPADLALVNTARRLVDGEQVLVGVSGAPPPASGAGSAGGEAGGGAPGAAGAAAGPVDLNTATVSQLDGLPGIGPVLAQRIVDWRTEHGRFGSVDQLREVSGIGESKFDSLKAHVAV